MTEECNCDQALELKEDIKRLIKAAEPFASFACSGTGDCECHNCNLRDLINSMDQDDG